VSARFSDLHLAHALPGRIRVRAHRFKRRPEHAHEVARRLATIHGVHQAEANPTTGSVTVHYEPSALRSVEFLLKLAAAFGLSAADIEPKELEEWLQAFGASPDGSMDVRRTFEGAWQGLNRVFADVTGGRVDLKFIFPVVLLVLGVRSVMGEEKLAFPKWYEFFWFAFGAYFTLNKPESQNDAAT